VGKRGKIAAPTDKTVGPTILSGDVGKRGKIAAPTDKTVGPTILSGQRAERGKSTGGSAAGLPYPPTKRAARLPHPPKINERGQER